MVIMFGKKNYQIEQNAANPGFFIHPVVTI